MSEATGSKKSEIYVASSVFEVIALEDSILPPVTSKVLKQIIELKGGWLAKLASSREAYKPLFISMLYKNNTPLYSTSATTKPIIVRRGEILWARLGVVGSSNILEELMGIEGRWKTSYGSFELYPISIEARSPESLSLRAANSSRPTGVLRIVARTPVSISSKILVAGDPEYAKKIPRVYRLMPTPGVVAAYAFKLWNRVMGGDYMIYFRDGYNRDASMIARAAEVWVAEIDYNVKPATVIVGRDDKGVLRKARGWKGWVLYRVYGKKLAAFLDKFLALATFIGLGKSRGIGLGDIIAEWIEFKPLKKKQQ